jgi:hypothetical protein
MQLRSCVAYGTIIIENGKFRNFQGGLHMKRLPKILAALLVLTLFVGICATTSFAAADLKEVRLTVDQLKVGYYNNTNLTGDIILHCANSDITKETRNLVDDKSNPFYWSKPYAFDDLKAYGGSKVPAILIDVANGGEPVNICGFEMQLRAYLDCIPYWFEIQATTSANSDQWINVFEDDNTVWDGAEYHCEFNEVTVYKVRILFYDIGDADIAKDTAYGTLPSGSTRFSLSEINLLTKRNATTAPTEAPTQSPTAAPTQAPTAAPTQAPTAAPTQAPTVAPTQAPTAAPTQAPTAAPTQAPTAAPTAAPTQAPTAAPTTAPTQAPTQEVTTPATEAPVETAPVETAPPVDTTEPTTAPTEEIPTLITTVPATAPATAPDTNIGAGEKTDNTATIIIIAGIVVAAGIAGGAVFFIIKKKRG